MAASEILAVVIRNGAVVRAFTHEEFPDDNRLGDEVYAILKPRDDVWSVAGLRGVDVLLLQKRYGVGFHEKANITVDCDGRYEIRRAETSTCGPDVWMTVAAGNFENSISQTRRICEIAAH
jgi:hypothetical protein